MFFSLISLCLGAAYCYRWSCMICLCVRLSAVCHNRESYINGWAKRDVWDVDSSWP